VVFSPAPRLVEGVLGRGIVLDRSNLRMLSEKLQQ
jgi:hypothetical protein